MTPIELVPYIKLSMAAGFVIFCAIMVTKDIFRTNLKESWAGIVMLPFIVLVVYSLYMFMFNVMFEVGLKIIGM